MHASSFVPQTAIDAIVLVLLILFFARGMINGALRTLLGPISLALGTAAAYLYYQQTHNGLISLGIGILGPFVIRILLSIGLNFWQQAGGNPSMASRIAGGMLGVIYSGSLLALTIILITVLPFDFPWIKSIKKNILASRSYAFIHQISGNLFPASASKTANAPGGPEKTLESTDEFQEVINDEEMKNLMQDPEVQKNVEEKNFAPLIVNPKFQSLLNNKALIQKLIALQKKMIELNVPTANPASNTTTKADAKAAEKKIPPHFMIKGKDF